MMEKSAANTENAEPQVFLRVGAEESWLSHVTPEQKSILYAFALRLDNTDARACALFLDEYGISGIETIAAVEQLDKRLTKTVIEYGSCHALLENHEYAEVLLDHIKKIAQGLSDLEDILKSVSPALEVVEEGMRRYRQRVSDALSEHLQKPTGNNLEAYARIESTLKALETGPLLLTSAVKTLHQYGFSNIEALAETELHLIQGGNFKGVFREMADQMLSIQQQNYGPEGHNYSVLYPELFKMLQSTLEKKISDEKAAARFYLFLHHGELVGFFRLDDVRDDAGAVVQKHLASVMGERRYRGGSIVEAILARVLGRERTVPIFAEVDPASPIFKRYLAMGFKVKGEHDEMGLRVLDIELPAKDSTSKENPK
jgi:hypothetical protein